MTTTFSNLNLTKFAELRRHEETQQSGTYEVIEMRSATANHSEIELWKTKDADKVAIVCVEADCDELHEELTPCCFAHEKVYNEGSYCTDCGAFYE